MINCSQDFLNTLNNPIKQVYLKFQFYDNQMKFIESFEHEVTSSDLGMINVDIDKPIRRSFTFSLNNLKNIFDFGEDKLIWLNKRVKLFIGLKLYNGELEYIPQGVYILTEPRQTHNKDGKKTTLTAVDKAYLYTDKRGKFLYETKIEEGIKVSDAIKIIAKDETMFNFDIGIDTEVPYELTYQAQDNRWRAIQELAEFAQCQVYYDVHGFLRLKKIDLNNIQNYAPVWSFFIGDKYYAGSVRVLDEGNLANRIMVLGGSGQTAIASYMLTVDEEFKLVYTDSKQDYLGTFTDTVATKDGLRLNNTVYISDNFEGLELDIDKWTTYIHNNSGYVNVNDRLVISTYAGSEYSGAGVFTKNTYSKSGYIEIDFDWISGNHHEKAFIPHVVICPSNSTRESNYGYRNTNFLRLALGDKDTDTEKRTKLVLETPNTTLGTGVIDVSKGENKHIKIYLNCDNRNILVYFDNNETPLISATLSATDFNNLSSNFIFEMYNTNKNTMSSEIFKNVIIKGGFYKLTGSFESYPIDLSIVGIATTSLVNWDQVLNNQTINIKIAYSTDNGSTWGDWIDIINNSNLPNIIQGSILSSTKLKYKVDFITSDNKISPIIKLFNFYIESELWKNHPYSIQNIGDILYFHNNGNPDGLITTNDEAKWRAKWELMKRLGYTEKISFNSAPHYLLEGGDIIELEDLENGISKSKFMVTSFNLPIKPDLMTIECIKENKVIDDWDFI